MNYQLPSGAIQQYMSTEPGGQKTIDVSDSICYLVLRDHPTPEGLSTSVEWGTHVDPEAALALLVRVLPHVRESVQFGPNAADN